MLDHMICRDDIEAAARSRALVLLDRSVEHLQSASHSLRRTMRTGFHSDRARAQGLGHPQEVAAPTANVQKILIGWQGDMPKLPFRDGTLYRERFVDVCTMIRIIRRVGSRVIPLELGPAWLRIDEAMRA